MKATQKSETKVTGVTLELTLEEARQLAGLCFMVRCKGGNVSANGLEPEEPDTYVKRPPDAFDSVLFSDLVDALPPIGDDE